MTMEQAVQRLIEHGLVAYVALNNTVIVGGTSELEVENIVRIAHSFGIRFLNKRWIIDWPSLVQTIEVATLSEAIETVIDLSGRLLSQSDN